MNVHTERPTRLAGGKTYCACGQPWPCSHAEPGTAAAALAGIRERFDTVTGIPLEALPLAPEQAAAFAALVMDIPSLVAAIEAALELADKWDVLADRLGTHHSRHRAFKMCAYEVREAITAALAGEEAGDGR